MNKSNLLYIIGFKNSTCLQTEDLAFVCFVFCFEMSHSLSVMVEFMLQKYMVSVTFVNTEAA